MTGGWGGIRTLDGLLTHTPLAGERLQPLGHPSLMSGEDRPLLPPIRAFAALSKTPRFQRLIPDWGACLPIMWAYRALHEAVPGQGLMRRRRTGSCRAINRIFSANCQIGPQHRIRLTRTAPANMEAWHEQSKAETPCPCR